MQVHAARLRGSQKEVVIKVLKPGIEDVLTADLNFLYVSARVLEFLNPQLARASLVSPLNPKWQCIIFMAFTLSNQALIDVLYRYSQGCN